jgi:hypothetical protein
MGPKSLLFLSIGSPFFYSTTIVNNPPSNAFKFSYFSTEKEDKQAELFLDSAASVIPHPQKAYKGGEDAHFISSRAVGVADGTTLKKQRYSNVIRCWRLGRCWS